MRELPFISLCLYFLLLVSVFTSYGQNYQCKTYRFQQRIQLDTLPVEDGSVTITPELPFTLSENHQEVLFESTTDKDSIEICFRSVSPLIHKPIFYRDIAKYDQGYYRERKREEQIDIQKARLFEFGDLSTQGAITRGVSFGNRQNVFVNSALNLQMDGVLSDDLRISAVITDQNIPYQPEGNTQQIRDFDNVFIKLYNDDFEVIAGDIVLQNPVENGYFLQYYKNVQGLSVGYKIDMKNGWKSTSQAVGSIAKGQFISSVIEAQEGVQGPYKLRGRNGERFVIIMANSEKVYLDGQLLRRGFDRDYVIDYNLGEITFSNTTVITQYSRIRVDYEYANQYYARSNLSASQEFSKGKTNVYFNFYREKDNRNSSLSFNLDNEDKLTLSQLGDVNGLAAVSGIDSTGFIENAILYERIDSAGFEFYRASVDPNRAIYQIGFTEVGEGNGSYELSETTSNGRVYEWVGVNQGNYEPLQQIPAPNERQMIVVGAHVAINSYESVSAELAVSRQDQNLFSDLDDRDNHGLASKVAIKSNGRKVGLSYQLESELSIEYNEQQFAFIDRFRSPDFDRDWGYDYFSDTLSSRQDVITRWMIGLKQNNWNQFIVDASYRNRDEVVDGTKIEGVLNKKLGKLQVTTNHFLMSNSYGVYQSDWFKTYDQVQLVDWVVKPGYRLEIDHQQTALEATDSVVSTLMNYQSHDWFVESGDSSKLVGRFDYIKRVDFRPLGGELDEYTHSEEYRLGVASRSLENHRFGITAKFRDVDYEDVATTDQRNLLGVLEWDGRFFDKHVRSNFSFNTSNTRELRREYVYVQVATGEGTHTWRDENGDGVQDLNEFYEAINPDEREYIKLFTPTDEYIQAYQTAYVYSLDAQMPKGWKNEKGILEHLSKLSMNTNVKYNFKTTESELGKRINPYYSSLEDTSVISARNLVRNTLFYNRNAPGIGFDVSRSEQSTKNLLNGGFELKEKSDWVGNMRIGFNKVVILRGNTTIGETVNSSDFLESRNYLLNRSEFGGQLVFQPTAKLRFIGGVAQRNKDAVEREEQSNITEYSTEITWIRSGKGNLNTTFSWVEIGFTGESNSYLGYELLEALQPGTNQRWNVNWQQSIGLGLQLSLQYYGRKSEGSSAVHTGSVSVTAYF